MGANIPLPALGVQPPPQQNLIGNLSQLMGIKSAMAQQQLQQQMAPLQVQASQQENQQRQQSMDDLKASTAAMQSWDGKNLEDLPSLILKHGGSANAVFGAKQQILAQKEKLSQIAKDDAQTGKDNLATLAQRNDMLLGKLQTVTDGPGLIKAAQEAAQQGLIDPQHAQTAAQIAQLPPDQFQQTLSTFEKSLMGQKAQFDEASKVKDQALAERKQAFEESAGLPPEKVGFADYLKTPPQPGEAPHTAANFFGWKAAQEAKATMPFKIQQATAEKRAEQAISDGDPRAAAQLLTSGAVAPSQIISSRKPAFAQQAFSEAQKLDPTWNAQKAEGDFKVAGSPSNVAFFGSAKSLTEKGGTLDQLADAAKDIPGGQIPAFNSIADVMQKATGSGPVAKYASILLGVADDYSKVMGGGQGSDSSREQAIRLAPTNASPEARAGAIEGIRGSVGSQIHSRIGNNKVLQQMYGDGTSSAQPSSSKPGIPAGATHIAPGSDGRMHYTNAQGQDLGVAAQ